MSRTIMGLAALLLTTLGAAAPAWGAKDETFLVSRQSPSAGGLAADSTSGFPAISADGKHVAFFSIAANLSTDANIAGGSEIYVRDLVTGAITLVSRRTGTASQQSASGVDFFSSISADGRYVAFASANDDLSTEDVNGVTDVFVRDLQANTTTLVSRETGAAGTGGGTPSIDPAISADGRYVAFRSDADNLSAADTNAVSNVFVRDLQANTTTLVSCTTCLLADAADAASTQPSISADGRRVAFTSDANNLSTEDVNTASNIFVRDLDAGTLKLVSRASGVTGTAGGLESNEPVISGDGKQVAFTSFSTDLTPPDANPLNKDVFVRDLQNATTTLVSPPATSGVDCTSANASVSTDARFIAFSSCAAKAPEAASAYSGQVFLRDMQTGVTTLISRQSAADGNAPGTNSSGYPSISGDGRWVAFYSDADNLSTIDNDGLANVFARDLVGPPPVPPVDPPVDPGPTQSGLPGAVPPPSAPPAPPAANAPAAVAFGAVATLPSSKACVSRRSFRIRLRKPAGATITRAVVRLNGKRAKTVAGRALTAPVDLRGLPKGRVKVELSVTLADGRTVRGTRTYRTCTPRRR